MPYARPLPALTSAAVVRGLDVHQSRHYFEGYYPDDNIPGDVDARRDAILRAIGCIDASRVGIPV